MTVRGGDSPETLSLVCAFPFDAARGIPAAALVSYGTDAKDIPLCVECVGLIVLMDVHQGKFDVVHRIKVLPKFIYDVEQAGIKLVNLGLGDIFKSKES